MRVRARLLGAGAAIGCIAVGALGGCYASPEQANLDELEVEASEQRLVNFYGANPPLVAASTTASLPALPNGPANAPFGSMQLSSHLDVAPSKLAPVNATTDPWMSSVIGDAYSTPPMLPTQVKAAIASARSAVAARNADWKKSIEALQTINSLTGGQLPPVGSAVEHSSAYAPERARWQDSSKSGSSISNFSDPPAFIEVQNRGLMLYCSAKNAYSNGGGKTQIMGRKSLATLNVLGSKIDVMSIEPTVSMAAPKKFISTTNDGAQAFSIPLAVGARVSPISLLPSLPEVRTPVGLVTADGAALARSNVTSTGYAQWQTATHADAFVSSVQTATINTPSIPLFMAGPFPVSLRMSFGLGSEPCSTATNLQNCSSDRNRRVLRQLRNSPYGTTPPARVGGGVTSSPLYNANQELLAGVYNDDSWSVVPAASGAYSGVLGGNSQNGSVDIVSGDPMSIRALQNSDKSLEVRTNTRVTAALELGKTSVSFPPFTFSLAATGSISGDAGVVHSIREQQGAVTRAAIELDGVPMNSWVPENSLSVTPRTEVNLSAGFNADLSILVNIPLLGSTEIGGKLIDIPSAPIASYASKNWPENNRLRIGTTQRIRGSFDEEQLTSHWPNKAPFTARTPGQLGMCQQVDPQASGDISAPCGSVKSSYPTGTATTAVQGELCLFAQGPTAPDDGWPDQRENACRQRLLNFVTSGAVKANQVRRGFSGVARVLDDLAAATWTQAFKDALDGCAADLLAQGFTVASAKTRLDGIVDIGMCSPSAIMYDVKTAVNVSSASIDGPTASAPANACTCSGSNCP